MSWKDLFEQKILKRGSEYCTNRAVLNLKVTENKITAVVNGSDLYQVEINLKNEEVVDMHCSCPYAQNGKNCKHMAAVLYKWERNKEFEAAEKVEPKQETKYDENFLDYINWGFYGKYYPDKLLAIKELRLNTDMGLKEAKDIIDELFQKIESINPDFNKGKPQPQKSQSKKQQPTKSYNTARYNSPDTNDVYGHKRKAYKSSSSTSTKSNNRNSNDSSSGCCLVSLFMLVFYLPFRVIFGLAKKYY